METIQMPIFLVIFLFITRIIVYLHRKVRKSVENLHKTKLSDVNYENRKRNYQQV